MKGRALGVALALTVSAPAAADNAPPQQLDEIVVTAQKAPQRLEDVPLSVTSIGSDALVRAGANDLAELSRYVPNLRVDGDDLGATSLYVRGLGSNAFNSSVESGVGFVVDDVYFGRSGYVTDALFDLARIEVLRGPQGTLFGKNTVAGLISAIPEEPGDEPEADVRYRRTSLDGGRVDGGFDLPLGDWGATRVAGMYRDEHGPLHNTLLDRSEESVHQHGERAKLRARVADGLATEFTLTDTDTRTTALAQQLDRLDDDTRSYLQQFDARVEDNPLDFRTSFDTAGFIHKGSRTGSLKALWEAGELAGFTGVEVTSIAAVSRFWTDRLNDFDVSPADLVRLANRVGYHQRSFELRASGTHAGGVAGLGESAELLAGVFWFESGTTLQTRALAGKDMASFAGTCDFRQLASRNMNACTDGSPPPPGITQPAGEDYLQLDFKPRVRAPAVFGQLRWHLSEHWVLAPALRYGREEKTADVAGTSFCASKTPPPGQSCVMQKLLNATDYAYNGLRHRESDLSPRLTLQYLATGGEDLYTSVSAGHKSGGYNFATFDGKNIEFQPEGARTFEAGAKGRALDNTLRYDFDVFDTEFHNLQVFHLGGATGITGISNAAAANSRGVEADVTWLTPLPALSLQAALGLLDAKYRSYPNAPAPIEQGFNAIQDLSGKRMAFAPRETAAVTPALHFLAGAFALKFSVDALYQGDQYVDTDLDPATHVPACWKFDARASVGDPGEAWSLTLGGNNLGDERVLNQVTDATLFPQTYVAQQAPGRSLFATLAMRL